MYSQGMDLKSVARMGTTQFLNATLAETKPIFARSRINHTPSHPVTHLCSANKRIVLVLANKAVARFDMSKPDGTMEVVDLAKFIGPRAKINQAFLDPRGNQLVLALKATDEQMQPDLLYLSRKSQKPKMSSKVRGHLVSAIGWSHVNESEAVTGPILLGTTRGLIFEAEFDSGDERMFNHALEHYWKQVFDLAKGQPVQVTSVEYFLTSKNRKAIILASTPSTLYQFSGSLSDPNDKPLLMQVFNNYMTGPKQYMELPSSSKFSSVAYYFQTKGIGVLAANFPFHPRKFGWLTDTGIYYGEVDSSAQEGESITINCQLLPSQRIVGGLGNVDFDNGHIEPPPIGIVLTEFHALLVYPDRVRGLCLLNEQIVFDDVLDTSGGPIRGITQDFSTGLIYVFSEYSIHKYSIDHEERNVWKVYLEKGDFVSAMRYSGNDEGKLDQIHTKQALKYFEEKKYVESAIHYSKTKASFEEVALKFMAIDEKTALLNFLKRRLELVRPSEKTQLTMIVMWLVEIYLNMMSNDHGTIKPNLSLSSQLNNPDDIAEEAFNDQTSQELLTLMRHPKVAECIANNKNTFYDLLACHGDKVNLIKFASIMKDYNRVIRYHLQDGNYVEVMSLLLSQSKPKLFYQHGPTLMQAVPKRFVDAIIQESKSLNPVKLIPSLVVSSTTHQELEAIRYLEHCVNSLGSKDPPIHNYLISLYIKHEPDKLLAYLISRGKEADELPYDIQYTLRLCEEKSLKRESVLLHSILGQLDEATEIALQVDMDCAKSILEFAQGDEDRQRKIWLCMARHVVGEKNDIISAMSFLQECNNLVKIEDILPFFPDFVTIDCFKDSICDSLLDYSQHIQELKEEMENAYRSAEIIREEIQQFRSRFTHVRATDTCSICSAYLMTRPFHIFTCLHKFHTDCLIQEVMPNLSTARRRRLEEVQSSLASLKRATEDTQSLDSSKLIKVSKTDQLRMELDDLVASECIFCGDLMVKLIDKPFIDEEDYEKVIDEWK